MGSCVHREITPETLTVWQPDDDRVGIERDRLVDESGPDVTRLEQLRTHRDVGLLGRTLGEVEHPRRLLAAGPHVVIQVVLPVDLDDMDGDELGAAPLCQLATEADDERVRRSSVEAQDSA